MASRSVRGAAAGHNVRGRAAVLLFPVSATVAVDERPSSAKAHDKGEEAWGVGQDPEQIVLSRRTAGMKD
ncbi:MAG: hypothetical protein WCT32_05390 [Patescibacteria group bacterium]|jgi:hypothetical protein